MFVSCIFDSIQIKDLFTVYTCKYHVIYHWTTLNDFVKVAFQNAPRYWVHWVVHMALHVGLTWITFVIIIFKINIDLHHCHHGHRSSVRFLLWLDSIHIPWGTLLQIFFKYSWRFCCWPNNQLAFSAILSDFTSASLDLENYDDM